MIPQNNNTVQYNQGGKYVLAPVHNCFSLSMFVISNGFHKEISES